VAEFIRQESTQEVPEILVVRAEGGLPAYLEWVLKEVRAGEPRSSRTC
jgi:uncharacterized protein involved in tolerance to divalent cations